MDGQDEDHYDRCIEHISKKIVQSKHLTSLKITKMDNFSVDELVSIALKNCPKLIHLEFPTELPKKKTIRCGFFPPPVQGPEPRRYRSALSSIKDYGIGLKSIKIWCDSTLSPG